MLGSKTKHVTFFILSFGLIAACSGVSLLSSGGSQPLTDAVKQAGMKSADGKSVALLCQLAHAHAEYMAQRQQISHDNYQSDRASAITRAGGKNSGEIVASNCGFGNTLTAAAQRCVQSWTDSPGHYELMAPYWENHCYDIVESNGCYYCIGLFANGL